jgi:hypothetical protein
MSMILDGTNGATFNDGSLQGAAASPFSLKNRIINGDMVIDQRNNGASITLNDGDFPVDKFQGSCSISGKMTAQQSSTVPSDFVNSVVITSSSAYSVGSGDVFAFTQKIEGYNIADLRWGTASAKTVTLSFWVRSSLTGTFGGTLQNSARDRNYPFTYTISSANTWEQKTITITGDTTGTWLTTNGVGIQLNFGLGMGSTYSGTAGAWASGNIWSATGAISLVGTNGATFYITGVQLERNTTATPFEWIPYGTELALCQRYYEKTVLGNMQIPNGLGSAMINPISFHVTKRASPTMATITAATLNGAGSTGLNGVSVDGFGLQFVNSSGTNNFFTNSPVYSANAEL